jgi:hypothetical protein
LEEYEREIQRRKIRRNPRISIADQLRENTGEIYIPGDGYQRETEFKDTREKSVGNEENIVEVKYTRSTQ